VCDLGHRSVRRRYWAWPNCTSSIACPSRAVSRALDLYNKSPTRSVLVMFPIRCSCRRPPHPISRRALRRQRRPSPKLRPSLISYHNRRTRDGNYGRLAEWEGWRPILWGTLGRFATVAVEFEQAANPVELDFNVSINFLPWTTLDLKKIEQAANPVELDLNVSIHAAGISCLEPTLDLNVFLHGAGINVIEFSRQRSICDPKGPSSNPPRLVSILCTHSDK
jgi:hypothetical protein